MRVGIVGGGITGLALTHALERRGIESRLFERERRPGGVVRTLHIEGAIAEAGPQRTRLVPPVARLIEELGLGDRVVRARPGSRLYIWTRGRLRSVSAAPWTLLASDLLTLRGRSRLLLEPLTGGLRHDETVAGYFRRKAGGEAYRTLFGPLVSATFASDPEAMPARHSLPMILDPLGVRRSLVTAAARRRAPAPVACTFSGGMSEITDALAARHGARIELGAEVRAIAPSSGGITLRWVPRDRPATGELEERFDAAVLTVPAGAAARILGAGEPSLALAGLRYNEVAVASLLADEVPAGFGFQTALDAPWRVRGVSWTGSVFGRGGSCTAYLGGGLDPEIASWPDDRIARQAAEEVARIQGGRPRVIAVTRARLPAFDHSWDALDGIAPPAGVTLLASYAGRLGIAGRIAQAEAFAASLGASGVAAADRSRTLSTTARMTSGSDPGSSP